MNRLYISASTQDGIEENLAFDFVENLLPGLTTYFDIKTNVGDRNKSVNRIVMESNIFMPDFHLSIHFNASDNYQATGVEGWVSKDSTRGHKMAEILLNRLAHISKLRLRAGSHSAAKETRVDMPKKLAELDNVNAPALLLEICFYTNPEDMKIYEQKKDEIIKTIQSGIFEYFGQY